MRFKFSEKIIQTFSKWLTHTRPPRRSYLFDFDRLSYEVRPGDVLLVEGRSRISRIIQKVTLSPWSHAALYIGRVHDIDDPIMRKVIKKNYNNPGNQQLLIESLIGRGTFIREMSFYRQDHIRICRPQGLSRQDAQKVINFAISHVGMEYSIRHILDLARFLFPWSILPRRWRSSLFEHNALKPTEEICSSMIAQAFSSVDFPILPLVRRLNDDKFEVIHRNPHLFTPSDFDYSPYFAIIKYPIFSLDEPAHYRELPWKQNTWSNDDESIMQLEHEKKENEENKQKNNH